MKGLKAIILKDIAEQIKKIAQAAGGTTSYWGMYQPEEPKNSNLQNTDKDKFTSEKQESI